MYFSNVFYKELNTFHRKNSNELSRIIFKTVNRHCLQFLGEDVKTSKWLIYSRQHDDRERDEMDSVCICHLYLRAKISLMTERKISIIYSAQSRLIFRKIIGNAKQRQYSRLFFLCLWCDYVTAFLWENNSYQHYPQSCFKEIEYQWLICFALVPFFWAK